MALTDFEAIIKNYMEERLKESYPEISMSGNVLSDLYINPFIEVNKPLIVLLNKIDRMQSLYNAKYMTTNELDIIGSGNYGVVRRAGSRASGYVYVEMDPQYVGPEDVVIPVMSVESNNKLKFKSRSATIIRCSEDDKVTIIGTVIPGIATDYFNVATGRYEFPVYVEAEAEGEEYNVGANSLTTLLTHYALLTGTVTNREAFGNGSSMESNEDYVRRIVREPITRAVGTNSWHKNHVIKNFTDACNVYVVGYRHKMMNRDLFTVKGHDGNKEIHVGGKVDLYISGSDIQSYEQPAYIYSDMIRLDNPRLKREDTILFNNITNPDNNDLAVNLVFEFPETKTGYINAQVIAGNSGELPSSGDELEVRYISYLDDNYFDTFVYIQRFYYKSNKVRLDGVPFKEIITIRNETTETDIGLDNMFEIVRSLPQIETALCPDQAECALTEIKLNADMCLAVTDYYKGHTIKIVEGIGLGQEREITAYEATTLIATLDSPWDIKPDVTSKYRIVSNTNKLENSARDTMNIVINMDSTDPETMLPHFNHGDLLTLTYTYNKVISDIQKDYEVNEKRGIGADVLVREGIPEYVYVGLRIKCKYGRLLTTAQKFVVQSAITDIIASMDFDSELQLSDLVGMLYNIPDVEVFMDYIVMPPVFFSSPDVLPYTDEYIMSLTDADYCKSNIIFDEARYPVLAKCIVVDAE